MNFEAPAVELNAWHSFDGEMYFVDALGRPREAYKRLPPVVEGERIDSCQVYTVYGSTVATVGQFLIALFLSVLLDLE